MTPYTYETVGATQPAEPHWAPTPPRMRRFERTVVIGKGAAVWEAATEAVLYWGIKQRSGFRVAAVDGAGDVVTAGAEYHIRAGWGPVTIVEPVRVVTVVESGRRRGFAYGTLPGHPVSGEEAFVVHRDEHGTVRLTIRSLTRPARTGRWRLAFPALLLAQLIYRRRYLRVLVH
ncbi:DUF1990 family protein [Nocardia stercoris]|uniref:DUF1990 domain-containing protein n=1 Tax=Nocardia stercoris TaxID=2483361 RepID=A0A3M2L7A9_9NOCA|nr:DUF1990 domain-containing protein [Nocardia stercoris]RMI33417.1 DUF1990 domain-containing protein [Nocardia stercoris]